MGNVNDVPLLRDGALQADQTSPALDDLTAAVAHFCATDFGATPRVIVAEELKQLRQLIDQLELQFAQRAHAFETSQEQDCYRHEVAFQWIRHECHMSGVATSNALTVGEQWLQLPASVAAFEVGAIGFGHLAHLASLRASVQSTGHGLDFDEQPLLEQALQHSVSRFKYDCEHARHQADAASVLDEHVDAVEHRSLELAKTANGFSVRGFLDPVGGATVLTALQPLAKKQGKADTRLLARRLGDAVVELAHHVMDRGTLPRQGGVRPHLQITAPVETVLGMRGAPGGHLQFAPVIPAATVQRYACDAMVRRVLFDAKSVIVDVGRARRAATGPARQAVNARDPYCVWNGCDRPAALTQTHHVDHWGRDHGPSDTDNMVPVCLRHHWLLHEGGWELAQDEDGHWITIPPVPRLPFRADGTRRGRDVA